MDLYRLRIEVPDEPGRIGWVLVALGDLGVNVVEIDCQSVDGDVRVDDLPVHLTRSLDLPAIEYTVVQAGCGLAEIRPLSPHDLEDPVTRGMRLVAEATSTDSPNDGRLAWCAGELVRSDLACVIDARVAAIDSPAGRAIVTGVAVHGNEGVKRLSANGGQPWALAVPFERNGGAAALVVHRTASPFTRTETARLRTLLNAWRRHTELTHPAETNEATGGPRRCVD